VSVHYSSVVRILIFRKKKTCTPSRSGSVSFVSRHHVPVSACLMPLCLFYFLLRPSSVFYFLEDEDLNTVTLRFCHIRFSEPCSCVRVSYVPVSLLLYMSSIVRIFIFQKTKTWTPPRSGRFCHICFSSPCPCVRISYDCVFFTLYFVHRSYFHSFYVVHRPYFNF
jgi:hypothetical protein